MSKSHLPYPGKFESHNSWMSRCDQWKKNRHRNQSRGLSGKPDFHGYKPISENYTFAYNPQTNCDQTVACAELIIGTLKPDQRVNVVKYGWGSQYAGMTQIFAQRNGFGYACLKFGQGMTARYDGIAYDISELRNAVYSNDDH